MALGQIAALAGTEGVKYLLNQRAKGQQERKQQGLDSMAALQGNLTGQPQRPGMAGPPGGMLGAGQQMMNDPQIEKMIQDMLFKYLFQGGQAPGTQMPNPQGMMQSIRKPG